MFRHRRSEHRFTRASGALVLGVAALACVQSCNIVIGLDAYYDCPEDPRCPAPDGGMTATNTGSGGHAPGPTCSDDVKNGSETGKDCGGSCDPCPDGEGCQTGADCQGKACANGACLSPGCTDKIKNDDETDVDCGGKTCAPCAFGANCKTSTDCATGFCNASTCDAETIVDNLASPNSLAVAFDKVYWTEPDLGKVMQADLATGMPVEVATGQAPLESVLVVPGYIFWVEPNVGNVMVKPNVPELPPLPYQTGLPHPTSLAYDGTNIYWTDAGSSPSSFDGSVWTGFANDLGGGTALASGLLQPDRIAAVLGVAVFSTLGGSISRVSKTGGAPFTLASSTSVRGLAVDTTFAYWTDGGTPGTVAKIPIAGGSATVIASGQAKPAAVAVDTLYVYWINQGVSLVSGAIMKAPVGGGEPTALALEQNEADSLVLYGAHVYWTTRGTGATSSVKRVRK